MSDPSPVPLEYAPRSRWTIRRRWAFVIVAVAAIAVAGSQRQRALRWLEVRALYRQLAALPPTTMPAACATLAALVKVDPAFAVAADPFDDLTRIPVHVLQMTRPDGGTRTLLLERPSLIDRPFDRVACAIVRVPRWWEPAASAAVTFSGAGMSRNGLIEVLEPPPTAAVVRDAEDAGLVRFRIVARSRVGGGARLASTWVGRLTDEDRIRWRLESSDVNGGSIRLRAGKTFEFVDGRGELIPINSYEEGLVRVERLLTGKSP